MSIPLFLFWSLIKSLCGQKQTLSRTSICDQFLIIMMAQNLRHIILIINKKVLLKNLK